MSYLTDLGLQVVKAQLSSLSIVSSKIKFTLLVLPDDCVRMYTEFELSFERTLKTRVFMRVGIDFCPGCDHYNIPIAHYT